LLGVFVVLRRVSLLGDAAGHATLPGVVAAFLIFESKSMPVLYGGAVLTAGLAALMVSVLSQRKGGRVDSAIGVALSTFFGFGIVLFSYAQNNPSGAQSGLQSFLFGNAAAMTIEQLGALIVVGVLSFLGVGIGYRALEVTSFDEDWSNVSQFHPRRVRMILLVWLSFVVVVSIQSVGVVLVSAMLVIAPSVGLIWRNDLPGVIVVSLLTGLISGIGGAWASFVWEGVGTGPAMVLSSAGLLTLSVVARSLGRLRAV
jgi:manganese/zinc/iron transport system permease protein